MFQYVRWHAYTNNTNTYTLQVVCTGEEYPPEVWAWILQVEADYCKKVEASVASPESTSVDK